MQGKFSSLTKRNGAYVAGIGFEPSVNMLMLLDVLGQTEVLVAVLASQLLLQVVLLVVTLQAELSLEYLAALQHVALKKLFVVLLLLAVHFIVIIMVVRFHLSGLLDLIKLEID